MSEQQPSSDEKAQFAAYMGIDWADQKHVWSLQVAATGKREHGDVGHSPEAVEEWINGWMARFPGQQLAVALEQSRGGVAEHAEQVPTVDLVSGSPGDDQPVASCFVSVRRQRRS